MVLRIFKKIATSGFLTALECTKFVFVRGFGTEREKPSHPYRKFLDPPLVVFLSFDAIKTCFSAIGKTAVTFWVGLHNCIAVGFKRRFRNWNNFGSVCRDERRRSKLHSLSRLTCSFPYMWCHFRSVPFLAPLRPFLCPSPGSPTPTSAFLKNSLFIFPFISMPFSSLPTRGFFYR